MERWDEVKDAFAEAAVVRDEGRDWDKWGKLVFDKSGYADV